MTCKHTYSTLVNRYWSSILFSVMEKLLRTDTSDSSDVECPLPESGVILHKSPARKSLNEITHPEMFNQHYLMQNEWAKAANG